MNSNIRIAKRLVTIAKELIKADWHGLKQGKSLWTISKIDKKTGQEKNILECGINDSADIEEKMNKFENILKNKGYLINKWSDIFMENENEFVVRDDEGRIFYRMKKKQAR